jgi:hypothetical protein
MALPTLEKSWNFDVNNAINTANIVNNVKQETLDLKNVMVTAGWTVRGSCDGAGGYGNDDDTDRWADTGDIVTAAAGSNHSWCVLQNDSWAARGYHLFVLLENRSASGSYPAALRISIAQDHYTGGTATAAPTSTSEVQIHAPGSSEATQFFCDNTTQIVWHAMWDDDGECFRWILCQSSKAVACLIIETVKNPLMDATDAYVAGARGWGLVTAGTDKTTLALFNTITGFLSYVSGHGLVYYYATAEFCGSGTGGTGVLSFFSTANPSDGNAWPILPIGLVTVTNPTYAYGRNGELFDLWWGSTTVITGDTYGASAGVDDFQFVQFGNMIFPWDGASTPQIA